MKGEELRSNHNNTSQGQLIYENISLIQVYYEILTLQGSFKKSHQIIRLNLFQGISIYMRTVKMG